jgi:general secretion pathway protein H
MYHYRRQSGFTLLEILVVLVLLGIILSVAVLSTGGDDTRKLEQDIQRMTQLIRLAQEEAILNGKELAIRFYPDGYEFQEFQDKEWLPLQDSNLFVRRQFAEEVKLEVRQDGVPVSLGEEEPVRVLLQSSGEMTPFEVYLGWYDDVDPIFLLTGNAIGKLTVKNIRDDSLSG